MADLLPSMASDEEVEVPTGSESDEEENDLMDESFEFGGILGEDGGLDDAPDMGVAGWSFQSALDSVQKKNESHPRMDVASLIAAKRKALKQEKQQKEDAEKEEEEKEENEDDEEEEEEEEADEDDSNDSEDDKSSGSGGSSDKSGSGSSSSDDDSDSDSHGEADEKEAAHKMEQDVLKNRTGGKEEEEEELEEKGEEAEANVNFDDKENESDDEDSGAEESSSDDDEEDVEETKKAADFFESQSTMSAKGNTVELFVQLTLSRPLLRGVAAMGFVKPTPIQASCIPVALSGRDICASAVTGSGKTAAFSLPILERLLHRTSGSCRALILAPTRELAAQCLGMISSLAQFTHLRAALIVGGSKNVASQAAELRARPDIIVATPGRLLDHVTNSAGVTLSELEFLVLDEADRLLDLGFQDEVFEIVKSCPVNRQTLLFSATMSTKVDDLIKLSLKRPVRIRISDKNGAMNGANGSSSGSGRDLEVAPHLEQEFVRIRSGNEGINREAILLALLTRTFTTQTIVFFDTKVVAHRIMVLCGLCGIKCAELHGNLTQPQRLEALESFRKGDVNVLLATDLAGRGIDIPNVDAVVNFEMPNQVSSYIHRIGRTARAGRGGRSCTLIGEGRRHLMKAVIKDAADKKKSKGAGQETGSRFQTGTIRSRTVPSAVISHFAAKIRSLEPHVREVLQAEAVARLDRLADMEATKAQNLIEHSGEIRARPQREWFASTKQKTMTKQALAEQQAMIREKVGTGVHRMTRKKRRAREALEGLVANDDSGDEGPQRNPEQIVANVSKAAKRKQVKQDRESFVEGTDDAKKKKKSSKKKRKTASDAAGDSSLFGEEKIAHASKSTTGAESRPKSSYHFRDSNPDALNQKKGKKKSNKGFKSKAKHKRR